MSMFLKAVSMVVSLSKSMTEANGQSWSCDFILVWLTKVYVLAI